MPASYKRNFNEGIIDYVDGVRRLLKAQAVRLNSASGLTGKLAQTRVDYGSAESADLAGSASLLDNLNHLRARSSVVSKFWNRSSGSLVAGCVVVLDIANTDSVDTTTTPSDPLVFGICQENVSSGSRGYVTLGGYAPTVLVDSLAQIGDSLYASAAAGKASPSSSGSGAGLLGRALSSGSLSVSALIYLSHRVAPGGGGAVLYAALPADIGSVAVVGSSGSASPGDHGHRGLASIAKSGSPPIFGNAILVEGSNVTLVQSSGSITISSGSSGGGLTTPLSTAIPADVGATGAVGSSGSASPGDHAHKGIHSISKNGSAQIFGDATLSAGPNITLAQTGQDILISSTGSGNATGQLVFGFNSPTAGLQQEVIAPFSSTITQWTILADQAGSAVIDIWKDVYANFPPTVADKITGSAKPTLASAIKAQSSILTGWTTAITAGDILKVNLDSVSTVTRLLLVIDYSRP